VNNGSLSFCNNISFDCIVKADCSEGSNLWAGANNLVSSFLRLSCFVGTKTEGVFESSGVKIALNKLANNAFN